MAHVKVIKVKAKLPPFGPVAWVERLIELRRDNPAAFENLAGPTRETVARYEQWRDAHKNERVN